MKDTREVEFHKRLMKFGRKNRFCYVLVLPVLAISLMISNIISYCARNGKRFAMLSMTFLLFVVYSSFSFPMFITGEDNEESYEDSEAAQNVSLAEETEIRIEDMEILEDADVAGAEEEFSQSISTADQYDADELLEAGRKNREDNDTEERIKEETASETEYTFSKDDWRLLLINKQHSVPENHTVKLGTIQTMKGTMQCDERIIDDLLDMLEAAKEDRVNLMICSPYRDLEYQKMLFNRKIERYLNKGMSYMEAYRLASQTVTVPGASEHQIGLALDIVCDSYVKLNSGFGKTAAGKWLAEHSCEYGFILRYPKGKEYITGIEYEPWHFRYVGVEAAKVIIGQGLTLEEFWEEYLDNV